jgi:hypothetical protein
MARSDREWVEDIISAIADIRADTAGMDFAAFAAKSATVRSVLYSVAVMGRPRRISAQRSRKHIPTFPVGQLPASATELSTNISVPIHAESGRLLPMTSTCWSARSESPQNALRPRRELKR